MDRGWLKTYWLFSFSNYYDPKNINFGKLRVFNDDMVQPGTGFPTHPHEEMEIVTIVLEGEITHEDSMGNRGVIKAGDVQRMSAGTGLTHSEYNLSDKPLYFYQIWIYPDQIGLEPSYEQMNYHLSDYKNCLFPVASGQGITNTVTFHTDATIYRSNLDFGKELDFKTDQDRKIFIYVKSGDLTVNGETLGEKDQVRIEFETELKLEANSNTDFILIDIPE
jgi:hypothetical protein